MTDALIPCRAGLPGAALFRAILLALGLAAPGPAPAEDLPPNILRAAVLPGWRTAEGTRMTALHLQLARGWKTYWRAPGDAGIPPAFDWSGSENLATVRFHWPRPQLFDLNGMTTIGYHGELLLPIEVIPADPARPVRIATRIEMGVCNEVCVPVDLRLSAELSDSTTPDDAITAAIARRPQDGRDAGLRQVRCRTDPIRDGLRLTARIEMPALGGDEYAVIETGSRGIWASEAQTRREGGALVAVSDLVPPQAKPFALDRRNVTITVFGDQGRVVEIDGCTG
jgi:hypothetical protein